MAHGDCSIPAMPSEFQPGGRKEGDTKQNEVPFLKDPFLFVTHSTELLFTSCWPKLSHMAAFSCKGED